MNRKQKVFLTVCGVILGVMLLFPPFVVDGNLIAGIVYAPFWTRPNPYPGEVAYEGTLCTGLLGVQILVLAIVVGVGLICLPDRPRASTHNLFHR
jgi:hypothetical protein